MKETSNASPYCVFQNFTLNEAFLFFFFNFETSLILKQGKGRTKKKKNRSFGCKGSKSASYSLWFQHSKMFLLSHRTSFEAEMEIQQNSYYNKL